MNNELFDSPELSQELTSAEYLEDGVIREKLGVDPEIAEWDGPEEAVIGNPEEADDHWHLQSERNSCAVACQEFVAEQLLEREFSEQELIDYAKARDWYDPASGTSITDIGKLLEAVGLRVERSEHLTVSDLAMSLAEGEKVICGVNNMILQEPALADLPGINANHAVEVIGIDYSDPGNPKVILNDPGVENGRGIRHTLDVFMDAWKTSVHFAVIASRREAA